MPSRRALLHGAVVASSVGLAGCVSRERPFRASSPAADAWPTARRGPANRACAPAATPPRARPEVAWRTSAEESVHELLVVDGRVYTAYPTRTVVRDAETGERLWTTAGEGQTMVPASRRIAAVVGGTLYTVDDTALRAFDARDGTRWLTQDLTAETADPLKGYGLQVAGSTLLLGYHGGLAAFDVSDRSQAAHRWTVSPGGLGWVYPAIAHGRLYVGSPGPLYAYERPSGLGRFVDSEPAVAWRGRGPAFCTWPAIAGERIVVCDRERSREGTATTVWTYRRDGTLDWRHSVPGAGNAPAVTPDGTVVVSAGEEPSAVLGLDVDSPDGSVQWQRDLRQYVREPIVAGGVVVVAGAPDELARDEEVRALDVDTGESLWTVEVEGRAEHLAAVGDRVYVGTDTGRVVALA